MLIVWNIPLIVLSVLVAMIGSFTALTHAQRMRESSGRSAWIWMIFGGITLGLAIWSMHFIGMLAFHLPIPLSYDLPLTLLSALPAIAAAMFGFYMVREPDISILRIISSGLLMGMGITIMHYTGMAALKMSPPVSYDPLIFTLSMVVAVIASWGALLMMYHGEHMKIPSLLRFGLGSVIMGLAICGMHYTAMLGVNIQSNSLCLAGAARVAPDILAMMVSLIALLWFGGGIIAVLFDQRMARQNVQALAQLEQAHSQVLKDLEYQKYALNQLAFYDVLTGLPNRRLLMDRLHQALAASARSEQYGALMFLDLDHFKTLNDTKGHDVGDMLLIEVAKRLQSCVRNVDSVARLGGDEFVVVLEALSGTEVDATAATRLVAEKIRAALTQPYQLQEYEYLTTVSVGVSMFYGNRQSIDDLLKYADKAMYQAKMAGRAIKSS